MCSCGKAAVAGNQSQAIGMSDFSIPDGATTEVVTFISAQPGFFTVDSGRRYKSYGAGTKVTIISSDRPALEALGLIAPIS